MNYVIYDMSDVSLINFSEIVQESEATLRLSLDGAKTVLKFRGDTPLFLAGAKQYTHSEILTEMAKSTWTTAE